MDAVRRLGSADAVRRLWAKDGSLFSGDPAVQAEAGQRLGWLGLASAQDPVGTAARDLAVIAEQNLVEDFVLLGMGGSSLAPLVIAQVLADAPAHPRLHVLDTTAPATVLDALEQLDPLSTWVIVSSKSGTTVEPLSLYAVFREWMEGRVVSEPAGRHFLAVTDADSPLDALARDEGFRAVFHAPPDVGGRYSALTPFGLVPAQLVQADTTALLASARKMESRCRAESKDNPGALLAAFAIDSFEAGRDKLTLATSDRLRAFGLWVEQLIAESTGKHGTGIVPVLETAPDIPTGFGPDRAVVVLRFEDDDKLASWAAVARDEGSPVHEIVVTDPVEIGGEFVRWEVATALIGHLLGIDPFDQPNVAEAKAATTAILEGRQHAPAPAFTVNGGIEVTYGGPLRVPAAHPALAEALDPLLDSMNAGDYLALLVYLPEIDDLLEPLRQAAHAVETATGHAVCFELGPRYLHSTGQLHKGGPDEGVFLMVTARAEEDLAIPGKPFDVAALWRAQAEGDLATLAAHGRRVVRVDLAGAEARLVRPVAETLSAVARSAIKA
ncbi:MAG TPA: glucose-6-phosphate isomerase [Coriobacteriia bacterium]|jgi:glucose-6-phosphate isomerase